MQLDNYLFFNGNAAEAMHFYAHTLGGKIEAVMKYSEAPPMGDTPQGDASGAPQDGCYFPTAQDADRVMHASVLLESGGRLMASDTPTAQPYDAMKSFALTLSYPATDEARRVFAALSEGGKVTMPMAETFWADAFGAVTDRFGTPWMVNGAPRTA